MLCHPATALALAWLLGVLVFVAAGYCVRRARRDTARRPLAWAWLAVALLVAGFTVMGGGPGLLRFAVFDCPRPFSGPWPWTPV